MRGRFWSVLAGGTAGDGFGSRDAWQWRDVPASLATPGSDYSTHAFDLFASLPWWKLRPSGSAPDLAGTTLITGGQGSWGDPDYITSALTDDHEWLLAYVPVTHGGARTFHVEMRAMAGPIRARWFDPATGAYLAISDGYQLANEGRHSFTTPGQRGDGTDDWLLVLDSSGDPRCGTVTATGMYTAPASASEGIDCQVTATLESDPSVVGRALVAFRPAPEASTSRTSGRPTRKRRRRCGIMQRKGRAQL
jgi:Putative collagen-binding domain of a collagenase